MTHVNFVLYGKQSGGGGGGGGGGVDLHTFVSPIGTKMYNLVWLGVQHGGCGAISAQNWGWVKYRREGNLTWGVIM